jgi:hypothetical protein
MECAVMALPTTVTLASAGCFVGIGAILGMVLCE